MNSIPRVLVGCAALFTFAALTRAQDAKTPPAAPPASAAQAKDAGGKNALGDKAPARTSQSEVASKTATFGKVAKDSTAFKSALEAHDLAGGLKQVDKTNSFQGTVAQIYEPRSGGLALLNFDPNYRLAMTAVLRGENFDKFPDLKSLVGKQILVTGKFINYHGAAEIMLTAPEQIRLAQ